MNILKPNHHVAEEHHKRTPIKSIKGSYTFFIYVRLKLNKVSRTKFKFSLLMRLSQDFAFISKLVFAQFNTRKKHGEDSHLHDH